ncbi:MAG: hypothetical protein R3233_11525, partial [Xanthomonadales bacterium]|nr:hypothetical protein [Xanthomonadales bacterium]
MAASLGAGSSIMRESRGSRPVHARPGQSAAMNILKIITVALALSVTACATSGDPMGYASQYRKAIDSTEAAPHDAAEAAERFVDVYADLRAPDLEQ